jgi:hypothetical protein
MDFHRRAQGVESGLVTLSLCAEIVLSMSCAPRSCELGKVGCMSELNSMWPESLAAHTFAEKIQRRWAGGTQVNTIHSHLVFAS